MKFANGEPFLIFWNRESGELSFNSEDFKAPFIRDRIAAAQKGGKVDIWDHVYYDGNADMKNPAFIRAVLESVGLHPSLKPPPYLAHLGEYYCGMELPPELAAIDPWTAYPPLPPGCIG